MSALPRAFDAVEIAQLEGRLLSLKARTQKLRTATSRARWLTFAPLAALALVIAHGALFQVRLGKLVVRELVVLDDAGEPAVVFDASKEAQVMIVRAGQSGVIIHASTTDRGLMVPTRAADGGFGATASCSPYTTSVALNQLGGRDDLLGYLSLQAHITASIAVQGEGNGFATMTSSIDYGTMTSLELVKLDGATLSLSVGSVPRISAHRTSDNQVELSLFREPVLTVGGTLQPVVRLDSAASLRTDVPDAGHVSAHGGLSNGPLILLEAEKDDSAVHLGEAPVVRRNGVSTSL